MSAAQNQYAIGLDKTPANYVPLTPLSFLARSAAVYPDHVSTVYEGRSFTWAQTYERCRRFASWLAGRGIGHGDTVAAMLPNIPAMNEVHFAVPMAGAVLNALNIRLDAPSIAFQLDHGGAKIILVDPEFSGVIAEALTLMKGPKPFVVDVDDAAFAGGKRIGEIEYEAAVAAGRSGLRRETARRRMGRDCAELHLGHHGQSEGRRDPSPRRLSQCRQQYPGRQSRPASGLSLDAADVPLQRLVLSVDDGGLGRHQCLPAQGRSGQDLRADPEARRHPHVRRADRLQHADQRARRAEGQSRAARGRTDRGRSAAGRRARRRRKHRHQADACLRPDRGLWPRLRLRRAAGLGRTARRPARAAEAPAGRALPAGGSRHRARSRRPCRRCRATARPSAR